MKKETKYKVNTKKELNALRDMFSWSEMFDMCQFSNELLSKALALSALSESITNDRIVKKREFMVSFKDNNIFGG